MKTQETIKKEIEINLKNVEEGKPLTIPLAVLNGEFKKKYKEKFGEFEKMDKAEVKAHRNVYQKAYRQRPEVKAYQKAYRQRPEVKAHKKVYRQRPEVKAHEKVYQKAYYQRKKKEKK